MPSTDAIQETRRLRFRIGERTVWSVGRRLHRIGLDLDAVIADAIPALPEQIDGLDGYDLRSLPASAASMICAAHPHLICIERQRYPRHFIRFESTFDAYLARFSAKTRSTLRRKRNRWIQTSGKMNVQEYHRVENIDAFHALAGALSARTYQERLLQSGLSTDADALAEMRRRAENDDLRAYILFHDGLPASYLYLPINEGCVVYAHLGYAPELAQSSPGTVLQMEALERLFSEQRFRLFDFTEGDGAHKKMFGTDHIDCVDLLLLRRSRKNRVLARSLRGFDRFVGVISDFVEHRGIKTSLRRMLRR